MGRTETCGRLSLIVETWRNLRYVCVYEREREREQGTVQSQLDGEESAVLIHPKAKNKTLRIYKIGSYNHLPPSPCTSNIQYKQARD